MFIGEYQHTLDDKGRLAVPAKFRNDLRDGAVVTRGLDNCLFLFTRAQWSELAGKLAQLPMAQANSRAFARLMLAGAMEAELDAQGRVLIPGFLRDYAKLGNTVIVAGLLNRLEIWDEKAWSKYKGKAEADSSEIAEHMGSLGV
jgi:MraZ protein